MNCKEAQGHLSAYIDTMLDGKTAALLESHIKGCPHCAAELQSLKDCIAQLHALPVKKAPVDFVEKLHARIEKPSLVDRFKTVPMSVVGLAATLVIVVALADFVKESRVAMQGKLNTMSAASTMSVPAMPAAEPVLSQTMKTEASVTFNEDAVGGSCGQTVVTAELPAPQIAKRAEAVKKDEPVIREEVSKDKAVIAPCAVQPNNVTMNYAVAQAPAVCDSVKSVEVKAMSASSVSGAAVIRPMAEGSSNMAVHSAKAMAMSKAEVSPYAKRSRAMDGEKGYAIHLSPKSGVNDKLLQRIAGIAERLNGKALSSSLDASLYPYSILRYLAIYLDRRYGEMFPMLF